MANLPEDLKELVDDLLAKFPPKTSDPIEFLSAQYDAGLAWVHFPVGRGGLGLDPELHFEVNEFLAERGAPSGFDRNPLGVGMGGPTLAVNGTQEQVDKYLKKLFTGEEVWCQLFSEPGAGSDLASLATKAVKDGDEWVVNGQKVWTTLGHLARRGMLVARTDSEQVKHRGLTYFIVDMHDPNVDVRPLRQMTGDAEFNETYMTDLRIPDSDRVGDVGAGWNVALTTLMNERVMLGGRGGGMGDGVIGTAVDLWKKKVEKDAATKDELMRVYVEAETLRLTTLRASQAMEKGTPGPEGSIGKLGTALLNKKIYELCANLMGAEGMLYGDYTMRRPELLFPAEETIQHKFLRSRANSIEGGTSEIMRNILAERVLGLPGDVRVDKDLPWSKVPR